MQLLTDRDLIEVLSEPPERMGGMAHPAFDAVDPACIDEALIEPPDDSSWRDRGDLSLYRTAAE